jgi:drug/metabolite transporter (DMT)-like permease
MSSSHLPHDFRRGLLFVLAAVFWFSLLDTTVKWLTQSYSIVQIVWFRYTVALLLGLAYAWPRTRSRVFRTRHPWLQVSRGALLLACSITAVIALRYLPLVDVMAVIFSSPLLTCALSVPLLGEKVGWRRWTAIAVGFVGVLIILRPGFADIHWAVLSALASAAFGALYNIVTRKVAAHDSPNVSLVYVNLVGSALISPGLAFVWETPHGWDWALLMLAGLFGGIGHLCLIHAFTHAPASSLTPFSYTQILWTSLMGYIVFSEVPSLWTFAGAAVLIACGLYLLHRERILGRGVTAEAKTQVR